MHPNKKTAGVTDGPFVEIDALAGARTFGLLPFDPNVQAQHVRKLSGPPVTKRTSATHRRRTGACVAAAGEPMPCPSQRLCRVCAGVNPATMKKDVVWSDDVQ
jgi:hypothetical protein